MRRMIWTGAILLAASLPHLALTQSGLQGPLTSPEGRPWPAPVATDLPPSPSVLSPSEALDTFTMPPGYQLELVASEPLVKDPILAEFDGDGRLWVLELHGFAINRQMDNSFEPINELVILEDIDEDGVYDRRTVFMDGLVMPRAFKVLDGNCALVGEPPHLWRACDTDGDLRADSKEEIAANFAQQGVVEHGANGLYWSMDNTIVVSQESWNLSLKGGEVEILPALSRGQWGVTQDDAGRVYRTFNTDPLFLDYLPVSYYARNAHMVRTSGLYEVLADREQSRIWPARPTIGINRGYRSEGFREDGSSIYYGGVSSPMIYRGGALPEELRGQAFVVDGPTNLVHLLALEEDAGGNLLARDFYERGEFLASTDERFRPVSLTPGWDGSFLVIDMYRGVSQDGPLQTDYLRNYILERDLWQGINHGRIYRVVHEGMEADEKPRMGSETPAELVRHLSHHNGWWRDTAQQLLVQRGDLSVVPELARLATEAPEPRTRLHALWTMDGLGASEPRIVERALGDGDAAVRAAAVRFNEERLRAGDGAAIAAIAALADDPAAAVRRQAAASLGEVPPDRRVALLGEILTGHGADPIMVDAAISGLAGLEAEMLERLIAAPSGRGQTAAQDDAVEMLAAAVGRSRSAPEIERLLGRAGETGLPETARLALLQGLMAGLRIAPGPGSPFGPPRPVAVSELVLGAAPETMLALAAESGPLAEPAGEVLALLSWPGKPVAAALAARTPEEERLFAIGAEVYANTCSGCHLAQGAGSPIAGDLAGSPLVTERPDILAAILLSGKEGEMGLMPPAGAAMADEELAAVMTFIRQSWGNAGSPVRPEPIGEWRAAFAHRKTPWTDSDLP